MQNFYSSNNLENFPVSCHQNIFHELLAHLHPRSHLQDCRVRRLVEESEQIRREFQKYIDLTFDFDPDAVGATLKEVEAALRKLMSETQWVPRNWVFS